jgi:hypothetical protein
MNSLEIVCECCEAHMRLSPSLLLKLAGKTGRVTCKHCENKIVLDGRGDEVVVKCGGFEASSFELEDVTGGLEQSEREAPEPPPMRLKEDSLSPHAFNDEQEDGLVPLGREFNSSPFASERDASYDSLFPRPAPQRHDYVSRFPASIAPAPPRAGELKRAKSQADIFKDSLVAAPSVATMGVEQGPDGELINLTDKKVTRRAEGKGAGTALPWAIAAAALMALGLTLSLDRSVSPSPSPSPNSIASPNGIASLKGREAGNHASSVSNASSPLAPIDARPPEAAVPVVREESVAKAPAVLKRVAPLPASEPEENEEEQAPAVELPPFSATSAASALRSATTLASSCRLADDPSGIAQIVVTFAPSGRVTSAVVSGPPYAGTKTGGCIASRFREARVPAFSGERVTVTKSVTIQ